MSEAAVLLSSENDVGVITLNRPVQFNCLTLSVHQAIDKALTGFENDAEIGSVLIVAEGKNFCTGADLKEFNRIRDDQAKLKDFIQAGVDTCAHIEASPLPIVVAVQGLCLAGGLELMMAADVVFASESARFGDQHSHFGLLPGWGGSQRLPRLVGKRVAMDLLFSSRWLSSAESLQVGLVNYVVEDEGLKETAFKYCRRLNDKSPTGLSVMKKMVNDGIEKELSEAIAMESEYAIASFQSDDVNEGLSAFLEKRRPIYGKRKI